MSAPAEAAQIQEQMAAIRHEVQSDVGQIVLDAQALLDWRFYVMRHPWLSLAAASALGFLVVPKRVEQISPDAETLEKLVKRHRLVLKAEPKRNGRPGVGGALVTMLANAALRAGIAYLGQQSGRIFGSQAAEQAQAENRPEL